MVWHEHDYGFTARITLQTKSQQICSYIVEESTILMDLRSAPKSERDKQAEKLFAAHAAVFV